MPIPGSVLGGILPFGLTGADAMYPSLATFRPIVETQDTTGQTINTFADSTDIKLRNLPCRKSPLILVRPQDQEIDTSGQYKYDARNQVNFNTLVPVDPEVLSTWQVKVDGHIYQIFAAESDGSGLTTRLLVSDAIPYGGA